MRPMRSEWKMHSLEGPLKSTLTSLTSFPMPLPPGADVPSWAFMQTAVSNAFNLTLALNASGTNIADLSIFALH